MAGNYSQLKSDIAAYVKQNGGNDITGNGLQGQLLAMVECLGAGYQLIGVATPQTNPGSPDYKCFYIAPPGEYSNFGTGISVADGEMAILKWDTAWHKEVTGAATAAQVTELGQYVEDPEYLRAIVDSEGRFLWGIKKDGSIEWGKGFPTPLKEALSELGKYVDAPGFLKVITDAAQKIVFGIDTKGRIVNKGLSDDLKEINERITGGGLGRILVAASDASDDIKVAADFVCDGVNDEAEIQSAIVMGGRFAHVVLSAGTFNIDEFRHLTYAQRPDDYYGAICIPYYYAGAPTVTIEGNDRGSTILNVRSQAWDNVPSGVQPNVITGAPVAVGTMNLRNFQIILPDNTRPVVCINQQYVGQGNLELIALSAAPNTTMTVLPTEGVVGIRGCRGSDHGTIHLYRHIVAVGFYEAFQIGHEHSILMNCGGRFNYYCFTFGNYDYVTGTNDHPVILINCADEHSVCLPLFKRCGWHDDTPGSGHVISEKPLQSITFIACNLEGGGFSSELQPYHHNAIEEVPGSFCGRIEFTDGGVGQNYVATQFWEAGSGLNFRTLNLTHAAGGPSSLRQNYAWNLYQTYFDTTLNKLLVYDGTDLKDALGNTI